MDITAVRANINDPYVLTLNGAPAGSMVEVRITNTMNGVSIVHTGEVKDGKLNIPLPSNQPYGQHLAFEVRVLTAEYANKIVPFHYTEESVDGKYQLVSSNEGSVPTPNPTLQPANVEGFDPAHTAGGF